MPARPEPVDRQHVRPVVDASTTLVVLGGEITQQGVAHGPSSLEGEDRNLVHSFAGPPATIE